MRKKLIHNARDPIYDIDVVFAHDCTFEKLTRHTKKAYK
jgi:hypothetical protein